MPDESDAKHILTAAPLENWTRPPGCPHTTSRIWNHWTFPWTKQLMWLRNVHSGQWCLHLALCIHSGACQKWMNEWMLIALTGLLQDFPQLFCTHFYSTYTNFVTFRNKYRHSAYCVTTMYWYISSCKLPANTCYYKQLWVTSSCAVPRSSMTMDCVREMWTPMSRWTPQHSRQTRTPRFTDNHSGSDNTTHTCLHYTTLQHTVYSITVRWLGAVVVRPLDSWRADRGFNSRPLHCRATTLGKLFTPMCLCSPSSIIWYLARAFMLMRLYVAAIHGSN